MDYVQLRTGAITLILYKTLPLINYKTRQASATWGRGIGGIRRTELAGPSLY
jgi:hypothetical protein